MFGLLRVLQDDGSSSANDPQLDDATLLRVYREMRRLRLLDEKMLIVQRQGRIGFYGEARGQEAAIIGTAAALGPQDWIVPALREAGAALYRGLPLSAYVAQLFGNGNDLSQGRQLPCHPGSRASRPLSRIVRPPG